MRFSPRNLHSKDLDRLTELGNHDSYTTTHKGQLAVKDLVDWVKQGFVSTVSTYADNTVGLCATHPKEILGEDGCAYQSRVLTADQPGAISDINTFGVIPKPGDILIANGHEIVIDVDFTAGQFTSPEGTVVLNGHFEVEPGVTLTVNGDMDARQSTTQTLIKTGGRIEFDGPSNVQRSYFATQTFYKAPSLVIDSTPQDKAFFGLKVGSEATFDYNNHGFYGANISGGNVHLNGFVNGYIHNAYDRVNTKDCTMPNVLMTNSGTLDLRYAAGSNGTCDYSNLTILSPTGPVAFKSAGNTNDTNTGAAYNLNGLSVDGRVEYYYRPEFSMNDWVLAELDATAPLAGWQDVDSWLLFHADSIPAAAKNTSNVYFRANKYNPHGFGFGGYYNGYTERSVDSVVFDFVNQDASESGDMFLFARPGQPGRSHQYQQQHCPEKPQRQAKQHLFDLQQCQSKWSSGQLDQQRCLHS